MPSQAAKCPMKGLVWSPQHRPRPSPPPLWPGSMTSGQHWVQQPYQIIKVRYKVYLLGFYKTKTFTLSWSKLRFQWSELKKTCNLFQRFCLFSQWGALGSWTAHITLLWVFIALSSQWTHSLEVKLIPFPQTPVFCRFSNLSLNCQEKQGNGSIHTEL